MDDGVFSDDPTSQTVFCPDISDSPTLGEAICPGTSGGATYPGEETGPKSKAGSLGLKHAMSFFLNKKATTMSTTATDPTVIPAMAPLESPDGLDEFSLSLDVGGVEVIADVQGR